MKGTSTKNNVENVLSAQTMFWSESVLSLMVGLNHTLHNPIITCTEYGNCLYFVIIMTIFFSTGDSNTLVSPKTSLTLSQTSPGFYVLSLQVV